MDLTNYTLNKQSTSISTVSTSKIDIDRTTGILREKLKDPKLGKAFVKKALGVLPQSQLDSIAEFALREGSHPGRLFVSVCDKLIKEKI